MGSPKRTVVTQRDTAIDDSGSASVGPVSRPGISTSFSVANINPGTVRSEFMRSIMGLVEHERQLQRTHDPLTPRVQFDQFLDKFAGPYLDDERNRCVEWYLHNTTSDRLLFIDSDIAFRAEQAFDLIQLAEDNDLALLGGTYFNAWSNFPGDGPGEGIGPVAYRWAQRETDDETKSWFLEKLPAKEALTFDGDVMEVDAMGAGFMAIRRDLLVAIGDRYGYPTPWFAEVSVLGVHMGEDMTFCVRAREEGHQPHLAPHIIVDHYKTACIRPEPPKDH